MKKNLFTLLTVFGLAGLFSACSSDGDKTIDLVEIAGPAEIIGAWKLDVEYQPDEEGWFDVMVVMPLSMKWERKEGVEDKDFSVHVMNTDIIGEDAANLGGTFMSESLLKVLNKITFHSDVTITAEYADGSKDGSEEAVDIIWKESSKSLVSYHYKSKTQILVDLHLDEIIREADIKDQKMIDLMEEFLSEPIPVNYKRTDNKLSLYLGLDFLGPILDKMLPLVKDLPLDEAMKTMVNGIVDQIPGLMENTEVFEISLNLKK